MSKIAVHARSLLQVPAIFAILATSVLGIPNFSVQAQGSLDPATPPAPESWRSWRLEQVWARQQHVVERLGTLFDQIQQRINHAQERIDRAEADGKNVGDIQAAFDSFSDALGRARPVYESTKGLVASHQGFDDVGNVTDPQLAAQTVQSMFEKLKEIRGILSAPAKGLRDAVRAFREANRPK